MKIHSKRGIGFQEIYTHQDTLPKDIEKPAKQPFIILTLPANSESIDYLIKNFPQFNKLGYKEVKKQTRVLTITSIRKVGIVINAIRSSPDYAHKRNDALLDRLEQLQNELTIAAKTHHPPPKSKEYAQYHPVQAKITREKGAPSPSHSAQIVKKVDKEAKEILKTDESGRRITEIEAFNGMCYRLLLNDRTPRVRSVHDSKGNRVGVISRAIDNFQSLHDYYLREGTSVCLKSPPQDDLVKSGIGRILAAAYTEEENDLHGGNIGYDPVELISYKIDHDQSTWPITSKYQGVNPNKPLLMEGERAYGIRPKDAFPITQKDITNFPHLSDAKPRNFPDETDSHTLNLHGIQNNTDFIKDAFSIFLKRALFDEQIYRAIAKETIENPKLQEELVAHKTRRSKLLKAELIKNKKFLYFLIENPNLKEQIIDEFKKYNADYNEDSPLRLDLEDLGNKFDLLVKETLHVELFKNHYKPDQDVKAYTYKTEATDSSLRKQKTKNHLKLELHLNDSEAEFIFNKIKTTWESDPENSQENSIERNAVKPLNEIFADIINLDGQVGCLGGEKRKLDNGDEIRLPRGVAAIFDLYKKYEKGEIKTAVETLEAIIAQAAIANSYQGHSLFNRRQPATSDFYNKIVSIQHRILSEDVNNAVILKTQLYK
ncbi:putative teichoic acid biosynthesis protein [Fluoribacter gormanii]|uniref:Uncharacterized protein n=2 Tax=Fluoribacter gormanii TaxID=464 RepID=A0A377GM77_9GAMM|nr:hypothetical protein [Fluoribacter gormanii]KTD05683.1 putative teichoic acid biosynthesis protein [Fluoribacter gormanii]MCW8442533.1 hypothetical protein [Fluoribacter gormanii]SIQ64058.1 hypothetical protein SAMN05421777_102107 [Fluoribacter gormanii]STO25858.1 Uncharacterised protein [Fluoribacter gormanii]